MSKTTRTIVTDVVTDAVTLQFTDSKGPVSFTVLLRLIDDPGNAGCLSLEIENAVGSGNPVWECQLRHEDGSTLTCTMPNPAGNAPVLDGPTNMPPPDSWPFVEETGLCFHLYFRYFDARSGAWIPANNSVPSGFLAGSPLHMALPEEPVNGKKIKVLYPTP